jgi:putative nucleotidyltransferase with HDIG domain
VGIVAAMALSMALARLGAALWMRHPLAREVLFADLMAWEWLRRVWVERRLARAERDLRPDGSRSTETLRRLASLLEARDGYTHRHSRRVARHALRIAQELDLPAAEAAKIWAAATLHDIGKLYTPREILNKPARLTDAEFDVIKCHPVDGAAILAGIGDPELVAIVRSHHERTDGTGYPDGLAGNEIPIGARIIAVADTFDALTSTRPYRPAATHKRALDILRREAGTQLDAAAVAAFVRTYGGRRPAALSTFVAFAPQRAFAWLGHRVPGVAGLAPAGWVLPAAAAASAVLGFSSHVSDHAARWTSGEPPRVAAVRSASASSARHLTASPSTGASHHGNRPSDQQADRQRPTTTTGDTPSPAATPQDSATLATTTETPAPTTTTTTTTTATPGGPVATAVHQVLGAVGQVAPPVNAAARTDRVAGVVAATTTAAKSTVAGATQSVVTTTQKVTGTVAATTQAATTAVSQTTSTVDATVDATVTGLTGGLSKQP